MRSLLAPLVAAMLLAASPAPAAEGVKVYPFAGGFEDAVFGVETAIVGRGLVIDYVSHVGEMLERTKADVGATETVFEAADVFLFCSAVISRKMMEADPMNIAHCPYGVFVAQRDGAVMIGHRVMPDGPMKEVEALLSEIAREAAGE